MTTATDSNAHPIHLADLLRMTAALPRAEWSAAADAMGYRWQRRKAAPAAPQARAESEPLSAPIARHPASGDVAPPEPAARTSPTLWRLGADLVDGEVSIEPDWMHESGPEGCFESDGRVVLPRPAPLVGRSRLARFLRQQLAVEKPGSRLDLPWAVARLARLKPLSSLRLQPRLRWPQRVQLVVQTDPALAPLVPDLRAIGARMVRWLGDRLRWFECPGGPQRMVDRRQRAARPSSDASRVVVLGDGGTYQTSDRVRADWRLWAARLERCGSRPLLLAPLPRRRLGDGLASAFELALLDESPRLRLLSGANLRRHPGADGRPSCEPRAAPASAPSDALTALTALLAGISAVEPALLRLARRAVRQAGLARSDIATEVEFVRQPEVESDGVYCRVKPGAEAAAIDEWRTRCASAHAAAALVARVGLWARSLSPLLQAERAETWRRHWPEAVAIADDGPADAAGRVWRWLAEALNRPRHRDAAQLRSYLFWLGRSNPDLIGRGPIALQAAWLLAHRDHLQRIDMPAGIALERMAWLSASLGFDAERQGLLGEGSGQALRVTVVAAARAGPAALSSDLPGAGAFRFDRIDLDHGEQMAGSANPKSRAGRSGVPFDLESDSPWRLSIGPRRLVVEPFAPPSWADEVWRDGSDWFAALPDGRRLRWVPRRAFALAGVAEGRSGFELPHGAWWDDAEYRELVGAGGPIGCPAWADAGHGADRFGWWAAFAIQGVRQVMRFAPPGEFQMGSPDDEPNRFDDERLHPVVLTHGFWIADTACAQALWQAVTGGNPSAFADDPQKPVEEVSWDDLRSGFLPSLQRLSPSLQPRLPTEAEWEYAARACGRARRAFHFGDQITPAHANYGSNVGRTLPVAAFAANGLGLFQMHGNVWEWVEDAKAAYAAAATIDPLHPAEGEAMRRVLRGGSWISAARDCRSAFRGANDPRGRDDYFGFRLARSFVEHGLHESARHERPGVVRDGAHRPADPDSARSRPWSAAAPTLPPVFPFAWAVAHGCDRYGLWQTFAVEGVRQRLRWLPPGEFWMGSPTHERGRYDDETLHRVRLSTGFWLGETVVTQALWLAVTGGENPASFQEGPMYPVERVSWHDIDGHFLPALERAVPGLAARLPWEAEWEYACREAGSATGPFNVGEDLSAEQANFDGRGPYRGGQQQPYRGRTVPVDTFAPNAVGLRDMHGGVSEWCQDWCASYPEGDSVDPHGPHSGGKAPKRVVRGGSWIAHARSCRSAYRYANDPGHRFVNIGFRLARGPFAEAMVPADLPPRPQP